MGEDVRVPGQIIGPAPERMTYADGDAACRELADFWTWVAGFFDTFDGTYDDVPSAFREPGTDALHANS